MKNNKTKDQSIQQEQYFQALFQQAPVPYQSLDAEGHILEVNQTWLDKMGYERSEVIGRWFGDFLSNEYHGIFMQKFPCFKSLGMVSGVEFKMQRKDGTYFLSSFEGKIGKDEQGNFKQTHCVFTDITHQKTMENNLIKAKEKAERNAIELNKVQEITHIGSWYLDLGTNEVVWTKELYKMFDFDSALPPPPYTEHMKLFTPESWEILSTALAKTAETGIPYELELITVRKDKSNGWLWCRGEAVFDQNKKIIGLWGAAQDITERKHLEEELIKRESLLNKIFDLLPIGLWFADKNGKLLRGNPAGVKIWGAEPTVPFEGYGVFKARRLPSGEEIQPDDWALAHTIQKKVTIADELLEIDAFDGKKKIILNYTAPVLDEKGEILGAIVVNNDVTGKKQAEQLLKESEARFKALHNASFGGIAIHDKGRILECNQGLTEITGYSSDELMGMDGLLLIAPETREMVMNNIVMGYEKPYEAIGLRKNGEKYPIRLEGRNIPYKGKNVRTVEFRDITIDKQNKDELAKQTYLLERAQDIGHSGSWDLDVSNNVLKWSKENYKIFEIAQGESLTYDLFLSHVYPDDRQYVNTKWQNALSGQLYEVEHRLLINGQVKWVWQKAELEFDAQGACIRAIGFTQDITARKKIEQDLSENVAKFQGIFEQAAVGIAHISLDGQWLCVNAKLCDIIQYSKEELCRMTFQDITHPDDLQADINFVQHLLAGKIKTYSMDKRYFKKDGSIVWVKLTVSLVFHEDGTPNFFVSIIEDITERKKNDKEIENINELLLLYIENSPIYTYIKLITSTENRVVLASKNFNGMIGGPVRDINGKTMHELFPAEFANKIIEDDWNIIVSGKTVKIAENFDDRNYASIKFPIIQGDRKLLAGYTIDITERKQAEEVAEKEQALSKAIIESIPGAFYMLDETGKYVRWNAYQRDQIIGKPDDLVGSTNALDTIHPDDRDLIQSKIANVLANGVDETVEGRVLLRGGPAFRWLLMTGCRMLIDDRSFLIGIGIDITERKQAEAALQVSNKRFEELFDNISSGVAVYEAVDNGTDFVFKDFNKSGERIENISKNQVIGKRVTEVFSQVRDFGLFAVFQQVFKTGNPEHLAAKMYQDNRIIGWRQNYVFKIPTGEIIAVYDDVTEEKKIEQQEKEIFAAQAALLVEKRKAEELKIMQEQLLQSEKMASIGQLGAGVAHELNSPLAGILSLLQSYKKEKDSNSEEYKDLFEMEKAAEHMTKIIKDLNVFSRQSTGDIEEVDCNEAINSTLSFTEYQFKQKRIKVEKILNFDLWKIRVNKNQIQQIVINMISNACDASFANGIFRIVTNNININDKAYVEMLFEDKGKGISKENLKKIFDPFFTTKRPGGGVGLGLSIVYKIIDNHKGTIAVESIEGQGTIFTVRLPVN